MFTEIHHHALCVKPYSSNFQLQLLYRPTFLIPNAEGCKCAASLGNRMLTKMDKREEHAVELGSMYWQCTKSLLKITDCHTHSDSNSKKAETTTPFQMYNFVSYSLTLCLWFVDGHTA